MITLGDRDMQKASASSIERGLAVQDVTLNILRSEIRNNSALVSSMTSMIRTMSHQLSRFTNLLVSVKSMLSLGFKLNLATYRAVLSIQESLSHSIGRPLVQEPFMLEDPLGRVSPVHLQFITSWEAFHAVLGTRFVGLPGHDKIERREFVLQEGSTSREISSEDPWEIAFRPGASVCMSIVFRRAVKITGSNSHCPHCGSISESETSDDVHWCVTLLLAFFVGWLMFLISSSKCSMIYRHVAEVNEVAQPIIPSPPDYWSQQPSFGGAGFSDQPARFGPYPKRKWTVDIWDERSLSEKVRHFKRVRILTNVKENRRAVFASDDRYQAIPSWRSAREHRRAIRIQKCEHCGRRIVGLLKELNRHVLAHHREVYHGGIHVPFRCGHQGCGHSSTRRDNLHRHERHAHNSVLHQVFVRANDGSEGSSEMAELAAGGSTGRRQDLSAMETRLAVFGYPLKDWGIDIGMTDN